MPSLGEKCTPTPSQAAASSAPSAGAALLNWARSPPSPPTFPLSSLTGKEPEQAAWCLAWNLIVFLMFELDIESRNLRWVVSTRLDLW